MSSERTGLPDLPESERDVVYAKTARGRDELAQRSLGLHARQRSLLILVDGRKDVAALAALVPAGLAASVGELLALGLIAPASGVPVPPAPATMPTTPAAPVAAPAAPAATPVSDEAAVRLAHVKATMIATAESCLGLLAAEVVKRIERAADADALLAVVGHWHMALQDSKRGRELAMAGVEQVKASLLGLQAA